MQEESAYWTEKSESSYSANMEPDSIRQLIIERAKERGLTLKELSEKSGKNHAYFQQFINRGVPERLPEDVRDLAAPLLGLDSDQLRTTIAKGPKANIVAPISSGSKTGLPPVGDPYGPKDFRIYSAAEGGPGEIIRSAEPVDWWPRPIEVQQVKGAYGMYIVGESMVPEFEAGQVAVINPNLPHVGNKPYIFYAETEDGTARATVKRLRRATQDAWYVTQHNPAKGQKNDFTLSRGLWRVAHRIVGRQDPS